MGRSRIHINVHEGTEHLNTKRFITIGVVIFPAIWFWPYILKGKAHIDRWHTKEFIVMSIAAITMAAIISKRLHWSVFPGIVSTLISGIYLANWKRFIYMGHTFEEKLGFRFLGADQALIFLLLVSSLTFVSKEILRYVAQGLAIVCVTQSIWIIMKFFDHYAPYSRTGFISNNASMDSTIIAMMFPFVIMWKELIKDGKN